MEWLEFTVTVPSEYTERAEAIAEMASPHGFYTEDYSELEKECAKGKAISKRNQKKRERYKTN